MSHADHQMAAETNTRHTPPAEPTDAPGKQHQPCCPPAGTECQMTSCVSLAVEMTAPVTAAASPQTDTPILITATLWASFVHAPEPPPPKA